MRRTARLSASFLLLGIAASGFAARAQASPEAPDLAREMAGVNRSLTEISRVLQGMLRNQRIDLQLRRIELTERRLAPQQRELHDLGGRQKNDGEELARLRNMLEQVESQIAEAQAEGRDGDADGGQQMRGQLEFEIDRLEERIEATRLETIELENEIARRQRAVEILEERLEELLEELSEER